GTPARSDEPDQDRTTREAAALLAVRPAGGAGGSCPPISSRRKVAQTAYQSVAELSVAAAAWPPRPLDRTSSAKADPVTVVDLGLNPLLLLRPGETTTGPRPLTPAPTPRPPPQPPPAR